MNTQDIAPTDPVQGGTSDQFRGSFADFGLPEPLLRGVSELGYKHPTRVQHEVYLPVKDGHDVVVQSRTGSGKTTAFCLPVLMGLDASSKRVQAIALCPTRELANQVATEASRLGRFSGLRVTAIYGGASMRAQIDALEAGVHFVVGTPGRVLDLLRRGHLKLGDVRFAILDEADEMLSMGFWDEVTSILDQLPASRQTLLFSATLPPAIDRAAAKYLKEPQRINLSSDNVNVTTIRHVYHLEEEGLPKPRNFLYVLEFHRPKNAIVFCNRRDETDMVCAYLRRFGFRAEALNGDMPQSARERVLAKVKAGELDMMVATDVAARGIDISDLGHVFNYDLPDFDEVYIHRSGRTGRIGKQGIAVSLVRGKYQTHLTTLRKEYGVPFEEATLPPEQEILWMQAERLAAQLIEEADGVEVGQYRPVAESMLERGDVKEILAFLLRSHFSAPTGQNQRARGRERDFDPEREERPRGRRERSRRPHREEDARPERSDEPRPEDGARSEEAQPAAEEGAANLYVTLGRQDGIDDLTGLIARMSELSGVDVGHFTGAGAVRDTSSHVEVDAEVADQVIAGLHGKPRGPAAEESADPSDEDAQEDGEQAALRTITCERARPRSRGGRPRPSGRPRRR